MVIVDTFWATIYVGFKNVDTGRIYPLGFVSRICSEYVNEEGLCITLTPTEYIYSNSHEKGYAGESGAMIGLINYPRFPTEPEKIKEKALELARILKEALDQHRVTVMFPDETIMLGELE